MGQFRLRGHGFPKNLLLSSGWAAGSAGTCSAFPATTKNKDGRLVKVKVRSCDRDNSSGRINRSDYGQARKDSYLHRDSPPLTHPHTNSLSQALSWRTVRIETLGNLPLIA